MAVEFANVTLDMFLEAALGDMLNSIVDRTPSISHHTGLTPHSTGFTTDLMVTQAESRNIPGFDMKTQKYPVGPGGQMRGGLLNSRDAKTSKRGTRYAIIPINAERDPSGYNRVTDAEKEAYLVANKLAETKGPDVAMKYLIGALGGKVPDSYQWATGRFEGAVGETGSRKVFRTVTNDPKQDNAWWYPPTTIFGPVSMEQALAELDSVLGGSGA